MKGYTQSIIEYVGKIVCDTVFFNPAPNAKYWFTSINKVDEDSTLLLKQVLLPNTTMTKIENNNKNYKRGVTKSKQKSWEL